MKKHLANIITGCRIIGSLLLLFLFAFSPEFYIIYLLCGLTDMIDGAIARKTNSTGKLGSQLDTIADLVFVGVSLFKVLPVIYVPMWLWIWGGLTAIVKISTIVGGCVFGKQFPALHTILNKITGLLLFLLPLSISFAAFDSIAIVVCFIATLAAIQEGRILWSAVYTT